MIQCSGVGYPRPVCIIPGRSPGYPRVFLGFDGTWHRCTHIRYGTYTSCAQRLRSVVEAQCRTYIPLRKLENEK